VKRSDYGHAPRSVCRAFALAASRADTSYSFLARLIVRHEAYVLL
jgi:hypothetical protein